jgi:hypothetical protein
MRNMAAANGPVAISTFAQIRFRGGETSLSTFNESNQSTYEYANWQMDYKGW